MKKLLLIGSIIVAIFLIYLMLLDKKIYYVAIGNKQHDQITDYNEIVKDYLNSNNKLEIFTKDFSLSDYRITDVINDINSNKKIQIEGKDKSLKNVLIKADLLTLSIGMTDIISKININNKDYNKLYEYADILSNDLDRMLQLIRQYCKEDIFLIGIYYPYEQIDQQLFNVFSYYNNKFKEVTTSYNVKYIDIFDIFLENKVTLIEKSYPSKEGNNIIAEQIIATINNTVLKNS